MGKQTFKKEKWALRRINRRYGNFVTMCHVLKSCPNADFSPAKDVNFPWVVKVWAGHL